MWLKSIRPLEPAQSIPAQVTVNLEAVGIFTPRLGPITIQRSRSSQDTAKSNYNFWKSTVLRCLRYDVRWEFIIVATQIRRHIHAMQENSKRSIHSPIRSYISYRKYYLTARSSLLQSCIISHTPVVVGLCTLPNCAHHTWSCSLPRRAERRTNQTIIRTCEQVQHSPTSVTHILGKPTNYTSFDVLQM